MSERFERPAMAMDTTCCCSWREGEREGGWDPVRGMLVPWLGVSVVRQGTASDSGGNSGVFSGGSNSQQSVLIALARTVQKSWAAIHRRIVDEKAW